MKAHLWLLAALASAASQALAAPAASPATVANTTSVHSLEKRGRFSWGGSTKMRGVNLGSWLVIEPWMLRRSLVPDGWIGDEWTFSTSMGHDQLRSKLQNHYANFITTNDIQQIADAGLNTVRIPIGYWNVIGQIDGDPYLHDGNALNYLKPIVQKAHDLGLYVILVMHGLPGSQNGQDNSGHQGNIGWFDNNEYIGKSWDFMRVLTDNFAGYGSQLAIELMNEAQPNGDWGRIDKMKNFYIDCYNYIRSKSQDVTVMFSDGWMDLGPNGPWHNWARDHGLNNVVMDNHIYLIYGDDNNLSYNARLNKFCSRRDGLRASQSNIWTIVGEWTIASSDHCTDSDCDRTRYKQKAFDTQQKVYEDSTSGWVYWSWKTSDDSDWSYKWSMDQGYIPRHLGNPTHNIC